MEDIREVLRTYGILRSIKGTARTLNCAKGTVRRYVRWATAQGFLGSELPGADELAKAWSGREPSDAAVRARLEPLRTDIETWLNADVTLTRIQELLTESHGWHGSYATLKRFAEPLRERGEAYVRLETAPGAEAQVDFGRMGMCWDPEANRARVGWLFLMTLSHSRHAYGEIVFRQDLATWIGCHRRAFEWFGGVPRKLVIDNLKAAVVKAALYDPLLNRTYVELATHYGFVIAPCRPGEPRHKGKVERGVPYVRKRFFAGRERQLEVPEANRELKTWLLEVAGPRVHGTTKQKPLEVFQGVERAQLGVLPATPFEVTVWKEATVHADCHVSVLGSYYSVPHGLRGTRVLVRLTTSMASIFAAHALVAAHVRAVRPGTRRTVLAHYPPEKAVWLEATPGWCLAEAGRVGPGTRALVEELFTRGAPLDHLRRVQGILGLQRRCGRVRLEAACARAVRYGVWTYAAVKRMLDHGLEGAGAAETPVEGSATYRFARPMDELLAHLPAKEG